MVKPKRITKKWRVEKAREIIDRNEIDVPFPPGDVEEFAEVVQVAIEGAVRRFNPTYPSDPRHLWVTVGGVDRPLSWNKAIKGRSEQQETMQALRLAVSPCLQEFRDAVEGEPCAHCGATDLLQVDHVWPPFYDIAQAFISSQDGVVKLENLDNGQGWVMADPDTEASWVAFHAARAEYQILCRSCNASKGKTEGVRRC